MGYESNAAETLIRIQHIHRNAEHCAFLAIKEGLIVGWIHGFYSLRIETDPFVEIGGLVVDANHRGQNIGRQLIEQVKHWSIKYSVKKLKVRCNTKRTESHQFYHKIGFEQEKQQMVFEMPMQ